MKAESTKATQTRKPSMEKTVAKKPRGGLRTAMSFKDKPTIAPKIQALPTVRANTQEQPMDAKTNQKSAKKKNHAYKGDGFLGLALLFSETMCLKFKKEALLPNLLSAYVQLLANLLDCGKKMEARVQGQDNTQTETQSQTQTQTKTHTQKSPATHSKSDWNKTSTNSTEPRGTRNAVSTKKQTYPLVFASVASSFMYVFTVVKVGKKFGGKFDAYFSSDLFSEAKIKQVKSIKLFLGFIFRDAWPESKQSIQISFCISLLLFYHKVRIKVE